MPITIAGFCAEFIRVVVTLTRPLSDYVLQFLYGLFMGGTKQLPPIENKILLIPATELAEKIRKRQLSCEEVMKAYIERAKQVHPYINATVDDRYEDALKDARNIDIFLASGVKTEEDISRDTPLLGVPFTCKEAIGVKGMRQTSGLVRHKDRVAEEDSHSAGFYRKAGAIPVTVTDVPELCMWWESSNRLYGLTKNPYDNTRTVGGSSGGEAALITSAGALFGIGNDSAGSIRIPCAFCGIYGLKPSKGIISNWGTFPFCQIKTEEADLTEGFWSTGPMCRYAQDLPLLTRVLSDNDQRLQLDTKIKTEEADLTEGFWSTGLMCRYAQDLPLLTRVLSDNDQRLQLDTNVNFRNVKVYYIEEFPGLLNAVVPDVKNAIRKAVRHFEDQYKVMATPITFPELRHAFSIWECKLLEFGGMPLSFFLKGEDKKIHLWWELFKSIFRCSDHTLPSIYYGLVDRRAKDKFYYFCLEQCKDLERKFKEIFEEDAIVLVPAHPEPPPHYLMTIPMYPNISYTCIFNILGLPISSIPAGMSRGVPIGIQAVSGHLKDHLSIAAALELDKVFNGWISPCPINV